MTTAYWNQIACSHLWDCETNLNLLLLSERKAAVHCKSTSWQRIQSVKVKGSECSYLGWASVARRIKISCEYCTTSRMSLLSLMSTKKWIRACLVDNISPGWSARSWKKTKQSLPASISLGLTLLPSWVFERKAGEVAQSWLPNTTLGSNCEPRTCSGSQGGLCRKGKFWILFLEFPSLLKKRWTTALDFQEKYFKKTWSWKTTSTSVINASIWPHLPSLRKKFNQSHQRPSSPNGP